MDDLIKAVTSLHKNRFRFLKESEKPKIGWLSICVPEEIIHAAGAIPYRITGETTPDGVIAGGYMHRNICPYVLSCFEEALTGVHNFGDGVVIANICNARHRLYDVWRHFLNPQIIHMVDMPKMVNRNSEKYYKNQLIKLIQVLERTYQRQITDGDLKKSILLYNEKRRLLRNLYELRKQAVPPITGGQAIDIVKAGMTGLNEEFNARLSALLNKLNSRKTDNDDSQKHKPRALICGSYFDHIEIVETLEALGIAVVCEDISVGVKYFEGAVDASGEPAAALADYYLDRATCAGMLDSEKRFQHLMNLIRDYKADMVFYFSLKFCDNNLTDFPYQKKRLDESGVPTLFLEIERVSSNIEQIKTRAQTFLETAL